MAIFHCSVKTISRGSGQSIVASAAYRHACKLEDARTGEVHDYSRKSGLESSEIFLPSEVNPIWARDRSQLWNAAEAAETRKNSRVGREVVLALPDELTAHQRQELTWEMARHLADHYCVAVDVAIHKPSRNGDQRNHHAHMLMSVRQITTEGFGKKVREMDDKEQGPKEVEHIRSEWAHLANMALERAGKNVQIDHRSFQRQGVDRMPTIHMGPAATGMQRRGEKTRLGERNHEAAVINDKLAELEYELYKIQELEIAENRTGNGIEHVEAPKVEEIHFRNEMDLESPVSEDIQNSIQAGIDDAWAQFAAWEQEERKKEQERLRQEALAKEIQQDKEKLEEIRRDKERTMQGPHL